MIAAANFNSKQGAVDWLRSVGERLGQLYEGHCKSAEIALQWKLAELKQLHSSARKRHSTAAAKRPTAAPTPVKAPANIIPSTAQRTLRKKRRSSLVFNETFVAATPLKSKASPLPRARQAAVPAVNSSNWNELPPTTPTPSETPASRLRRNAALLATKAIDFVTQKFDYKSPVQSVRKNGGKIVVAVQEKPAMRTSIDADPFEPPSTVRKRGRPSKVASPAASKAAESKRVTPSKTAASTEPPPPPPSTVKKRKAQQVEAAVPEASKAPLKASVPAPAPPAASNTPKVKTAIVEFVAPQSIAQTSKRPRRPLDSSVFEGSPNVSATPVARRQAALETMCTPSMSQNGGTAPFPKPQPIPIASHPSVTLVAPTVPLLAKESSGAALAASTTPKIPIVAPIGGQQMEGSAPIPPSAPKRTPIRVQPARTPTRTKAVIPTLGDYSASKRVSVIEVAKAHLAPTAPIAPILATAAKSTGTPANLTFTPSVPVAAAPKVESWTSKFFTGEKPTIAASITASGVTIKPLDTSKLISTPAIPVANVPTVPKFPLNLANISNISSLAKASATQQQLDASAKPAALSKPSSQPSTLNVPPPESPLSRAKRIDSENALKEQQIQSQMASKAEKLKQAMGQLRSSDEPKPVADSEKTPTDKTVRAKAAQIEPVAIVNAATVNTAAPTALSKLPVKPRAAVLPSPKIPSRLAEAFSGIDSELPPIDIGLVDDEQVLQRILANKEDTAKTLAPAAPKAINAKAPAAKSAAPSAAAPASKAAPLTHQPPLNPLHKTAVMNSAAVSRTKLVPLDTTVMAVKPASSAISIALKSPAKVGTSPGLPEIYSSDDELERSKSHGKENRPAWAMTPNLAVALNAQRAQRAEDIFGQVQPIKLEDFFKGSGKKFPSRTSTSHM